MVIENYYDNDVFKTLRKEAKKFISKNVDRDTRKQAFPEPDNKALQDCINSRPLTEDMLLQFPQYLMFVQSTQNSKVRQIKV